MPRFTSDFVAEWFRARDAELLTPYKNANAKLRFRCPCGQEGGASWVNLWYKKNAGGAEVLPRCRACKIASMRALGKTELATRSLERGRKSRAWTVEKAQEFLGGLGSRLLSDALPEGADTVIEAACSNPDCGSSIRAVLSGVVDRLKARPGMRLQCRSCASNEVRSKKGAVARMTARVHARFLEHGATPLFEVYPGKNTEPLPFLCSCPERRHGVTTWMSLAQRAGTPPRCETCQVAARPRAETHPNWKPERTAQQREAIENGRGYPMRVWGDVVRRLFDFRCAVSGESHQTLQAHHLMSYAKHPSERFVLNNGVALAAPTHEEFHDLTDKGRGHATEQQFHSFYQDRTGRVFAHPLGSVEAEIIFAFLPKPDLLVRKRDADARGLLYIPIFETEIRTKRDLVLSMLRHRSGLGRQAKGARSLSAVELDLAKARRFFDENHVQGFVGGSHYIGLTDGDLLYSAMSFTPARYRRSEHPEGTYELGRFATLRDWRVPGAASKLLKAFLSISNPPLLVTYADRRFCAFNPEDTLYPRVGFEFAGVSSPSYGYTKDGIVLENRMAFQKSKLRARLGEAFDPTLTEWENVEQAGYARLIDCGTFVYEMRP